MKKVNLIRNIKTSYGEWTESSTYLVNKSVKCPMSSFKEAIKEFLLSEDGKDLLIVFKNMLDWGDIVFNINQSVLNKHGFYPLNFSFVKNCETCSNSGTHCLDIIVNDGEILFPDIQREILNEFR